MSEDESALRQMMRLRGFSLMTNIMDDYEKDLEVLMLVCVFFSAFFGWLTEQNVGYRLHVDMATHVAQQSGRLQSQRARPKMHRV